MQMEGERAFPTARPVSAASVRQSATRTARRPVRRKQREQRESWEFRTGPGRRGRAGLS